MFFPYLSSEEFQLFCVTDTQNEKILTLNIK